MNTMNVARTILLLSLTAMAPLAWAHVGADSGAHRGFAAGFTHPFSGVDHLAAMLAVGFWSAQVARRRRDLLHAPAAFVALLLVGALLGAAGFALPAVEPMIAASLLVLGLLVASRHALPAAAWLIGAFALFHGAAHGRELAGAAALAGMLLATAMLHLGGIGLGHALRRRSRWWPRAAGAATALFGVALLIA